MNILKNNIHNHCTINLKGWFCYYTGNINTGSHVYLLYQVILREFDYNEYIRGTFTSTGHYYSICEDDFDIKALGSSL